MNEFKDRESNRWTIDLPIGVVLRVKDESEGRINLLEPAHGDLADKIAANDFETLYETLWLIVRPQAEKKEIDAAKFGELMAADCLLEARQVFWRVWTDFFQRLQRPDHAAMLERLEKYNAKAVELVKAKLAAPMLAEIDAQVEAKMVETLNKSCGSMQASLALILAPSPSDNSAG
jgi:hypothetical protein